MENDRHGIAKYRVAAFYKFVELGGFQSMRSPLLAFCQRSGVVGSILLANEGINGTIAGEPSAVDAVLQWLRNDERLSDLPVKFSECNFPPFRRMRVRLKTEIVRLGVDGVDPTCAVGRYVPPEQWNALIERDDVLLIDTRNDYEIAVGRFHGAINPFTDDFRSFPEFVEHHLDPKHHLHVAMYCTGGIRCEKSTSYLIGKGFQNVYHLEGGILRYLSEVPREKSLWEGECYVFDDRVSVDHNLAPGNWANCVGCGKPVSPEEQRDARWEPGVACPKCSDSMPTEKRKRLEMRQRQFTSMKRQNAQPGCRS